MNLSKLILKNLIISLMLIASGFSLIKNADAGNVASSGMALGTISQAHFRIRLIVPSIQKPNISNVPFFYHDGQLIVNGYSLNWWVDGITDARTRSDLSSMLHEGSNQITIKIWKSTPVDDWGWTYVLEFYRPNHGYKEVYRSANLSSNQECTFNVARQDLEPSPRHRTPVEITNQTTVGAEFNAEFNRTYEKRLAERRAESRIHEKECRQRFANFVDDAQKIKVLKDDIRTQIKTNLSSFDARGSARLGIAVSTWTGGKFSDEMTGIACSLDSLTEAVGRFQESRSNGGEGDAFEVAEEALKLSLTHLAEASKSAPVDASLADSERELSDIARNIGATVLDVVTGFTPGISLGRDIYEAISGYDAINGEELGSAERALAVLGVATLGAGKGIKLGIKAVEKLGEAVKASGKVRHVAEGLGDSVRSATRIVDSAGTLGRELKGGVNFKLAPRVTEQLADPRLGNLAGTLNETKLNTLLNAPGAQRFLDANSGHINVIQQVEDKLLRITVTRDQFKVISVGPIRPNGLTNGIENARFIPLK